MLAPQLRRRSGKWATLLATSVVVFATVVDMSSVALALPTLVAELDTTFAAAQWVILAPLLVVTGMLLPVGRAAQIVGRRRLYLLGALVFVLGTLLSGFATSVWMLVAFRMLQALGAGATTALGPALLLDAFPERERGRAMGFGLAAVALGGLTGPILGGALVGSLGWPFIFFINVPIGVAGLLLGIRALPHVPTLGRRGFDWYGSVGLVAGLALLLLGLNQIQRAGLASPLVIGLLISAAGLLGWFIWWQGRAPVPTIDLGLFRIREFSAATLASLLMFSGLSAQMLLLPFFLQGVLALPVERVGFVLATGSGVMALMGPVGGVLADRFGPRLMATTGLAISSVGLAGLVTLGAGSSAWHVAIWLGTVALGVGLFDSANTSSLMGAAPLSHRNQASATQALARTTAFAAGQALWGTVWAVLAGAQAGLAGVEWAAGNRALDAFHVTFAAAAGIVATGIIVSLLRGRSMPGRSAPHSDAEAIAAAGAGRA